MLAAYAQHAHRVLGQRELSGEFAQVFVSWAIEKRLFTEAETRRVHTITATTNGECVWFVLYWGPVYVRTVVINCQHADALEEWDRQQKDRMSADRVREREDVDCVPQKRVRVSA